MCVCRRFSFAQVIRDDLQTAGCGFVRVFRQTFEGKKGAALREGIRLAEQLLCDEIRKLGPRRAMIGFQEPEKVDRIRHWNSIVKFAVGSESHIVVPRRRKQDFCDTYPIGQYHSETFANLCLDTLASPIGLPAMDWTAGPIAFDISMVDQWLECHGEIWDAQLVPIIDSFLNRKAIVSSFEVAYHHPLAMKEQEGENPMFNDKRLQQLNFLSDTVGQRLRQAAMKQSK